MPDREKIRLLFLESRFDGLTLLHEFTFDAGAVSYRNRYLYPQLEEYMKEHGRWGLWAQQEQVLPGKYGGWCRALELGS